MQIAKRIFLHFRFIIVEVERLSCKFYTTYRNSESITSRTGIVAHRRWYILICMSSSHTPAHRTESIAAHWRHIIQYRNNCAVLLFLYIIHIILSSSLIAFALPIHVSAFPLLTVILSIYIVFFFLCYYYFWNLAYIATIIIIASASRISGGSGSEIKIIGYRSIPCECFVFVSLAKCSTCRTGVTALCSTANTTHTLQWNITLHKYHVNPLEPIGEGAWE